MNTKKSCSLFLFLVKLTHTKKKKQKQNNTYPITSYLSAQGQTNVRYYNLKNYSLDYSHTNFMEIDLNLRGGLKCTILHGFITYACRFIIA